MPNTGICGVCGGNTKEFTDLEEVPKEKLYEFIICKSCMGTVKGVLYLQGILNGIRRER